MTLRASSDNLLVATPLHAHFDAGELTIDDQQGSGAELAAVDEMYETVMVVPKNSELESEQPVVVGESIEDCLRCTR